MHHYLTKYRNGKDELIATAWFQINLFGRAYCFLKREIRILD